MLRKEELKLQKELYIIIVRSALLNNIETFSKSDIDEAIEIADKILDIAIELDYQMRNGKITQTGSRLKLMKEIVEVLSHYDTQKETVKELTGLSEEQFMQKIEEEGYKFMQQLSLDIQKMI